MIKQYFNDSLPELVKLAGGLGAMTTLLSNERLVKAANAGGIFAKEALDKLRSELDKDQFLIHLIAMGSWEKYGYNRNADAWTDEELRASHPTFVKYGHMFEEHRNNDPKLKIGDVMLSAYNAPMGRVELITRGDRRLSEELYEQVKAGKETSFSMSCKLPLDVCNCCGKSARTPAEYCDYMRYRPTQYISELGKYAFVRNPKSRFFDISKVGRPADRIAHFISYMVNTDLAKAASDGRIITGADWGTYQFGKEAHDYMDEEITFADLLTPQEQGLLNALRAEEANVRTVLYNTEHQMMHEAKRAFINSVAPFYGTTGDIDMEKFGNATPDSVFSALAHRGVIVPARAFFSFIMGPEYADHAVVKEACDCACNSLGMLHSRMGEIVPAFTGDLLRVISPGASTKVETDAPDDAVQALMDEAENSFGCRAEPAVARANVMIIKIKSASELRKQASVGRVESMSEGAKNLLTLYGLYKLKAAAVMGGSSKELDVRQLILTAGAQ